MPVTFDLMRAVIGSDLTPNLRHFVMTLALLADSETGTAFYGQAAIARAMGCSDRQVRTYFTQLEALATAGATPVRVIRKRRGTADGKGRSSDEWTLALVPVTALPTGSQLPLETTLTGSQLPVRVVEVGGSQPEVCDSSTGSLTQLNRKPTSGDLRSDRRRDRRRSSKRSKSDPETDSRVPKLWAHYHAEHERLRGIAPVFTGQQRGAVGKAWKSMLSVVSLEEANALVTRALTDGFHVQPTAIMANMNRYRGRQPTRGRQVEVQRGGYQEREQNEQERQIEAEAARLAAEAE